MVCRSYRSCSSLVVLDLWKKELENPFFLTCCISLILVWRIVIYSVFRNDVGREEWFWWDDVGLSHSQQMPVATPTVYQAYCLHLGHILHLPIVCLVAIISPLFHISQMWSYFRMIAILCSCMKLACFITSLWTHDAIIMLWCCSESDAIQR